jgi:SHS2 domain-containing protein
VYEVFDHTADVGLRVVAADMPGLLADAATGLFALIAGDLGQVREAESAEIAIRGTDRAYLLFDWLSELLYLFESRRLLLRRFEVRITADGLEAKSFGETYDPARHRLQHEVKAITYHQLAVRDTARGIEATVIVDI